MSIFAKIIRRELPADVVYEDDLCLAFKDIHPQAPVHIILVPKKEITSLANVVPEDQQLMGHMMLKVTEIAKKQGLEGYRVVINTGKEGGQTVFHLHFHLLGGKVIREKMA